MKKELEKDPALANENWDRFLPKFKKYDIFFLCAINAFVIFLLLNLNFLLFFFRKNVKQKKVKSKEKKPYTPFPPPQQPSKVRDCY